MTFRMGLSYLPLAIAGLDALEGWASQLPPSLLHPHFKHILPYLDDYLKTQGTAGEWGPQPEKRITVTVIGNVCVCVCVCVCVRACVRACVHVSVTNSSRCNSWKDPENSNVRIHFQLNVQLLHGNRSIKCIPIN